jgi:papain like cysteine protease AvrRpt2
MADFYLAVPFISQLDFGNPAQPYRDYTGCWYATACMIAYHFEAGPRYGMPRLYNKTSTEIGADGQQYANRYHSTVSAADLAELGKNEGLEFVPEPPGLQWTPGRIDAQLREFGPLLFGWNKTHGFNTYGHVSCICGVKSGPDRIIYHDPEKAPNSEGIFTELNARYIPHTMMRRMKSHGRTVLSSR